MEISCREPAECNFSSSLPWQMASINFLTKPLTLRNCPRKCFRFGWLVWQLLCWQGQGQWVEAPAVKFHQGQVFSNHVAKTTKKKTSLNINRAICWFWRCTFWCKTVKGILMLLSSSKQQETKIKPRLRSWKTRSLLLMLTLAFDTNLLKTYICNCSF